MKNSTPILSKKSYRFTVRLSALHLKHLKSFDNPSGFLRGLIEADIVAVTQNAE